MVGARTQTHEISSGCDVTAPRRNTPDFRHTAFSAGCSRRLEELVRGTGRSMRVRHVRGIREAYWVIRLEDENLEFFVYRDGADIVKGKDCFPFEWQDYTSLEHLCEDFISRVAKELERGGR